MESESAVATGTSGGLLDDSNRHAQSVFKHEILRRYMPPFVAMLGSYSAGKRVVVLDGFAGRGRYSDGTPASAELILQAVEGLRQSRQVSAFFVEKSEKDHRALRAVVDEYVARGLLATALPGAVDEHLEAVVAAATGIPLFLFLDPCGAGLPFTQLAAVLTGPRRHVRPQTELLLNFSADLSRRAAGALNARQVSHPIIRLMDETCGGKPPGCFVLAVDALGVDLHSVSRRRWVRTTRRPVPAQLTGVSDHYFVD
jgi:three-Cys-motif partner protein